MTPARGRPVALERWSAGFCTFPVHPPTLGPIGEIQRSQRSALLGLFLSCTCELRGLAGIPQPFESEEPQQGTGKMAKVSETYAGQFVTGAELQPLGQRRSAVIHTTIQEVVGQENAAP